MIVRPESTDPSKIIVPSKPYKIDTVPEETMKKIVRPRKTSEIFIEKQTISRSTNQITDETGSEGKDSFINIEETEAIEPAE